MDGRRVLGSVFVVAGLALVVAGVIGLLGSTSPGTAPASPTPAVTIAPTPGPSAAPTLVATAAPTAPPGTDPPIVPADSLIRAFFAKLEAAVRDGAQETVSANLGGAVIDRYGVSTCEAYLASRDPSPEQRFEIVSISGPASWDYTSDGRTTTVPDAYTATARVTGPNASGEVLTRDAELHVSVGDGTVFWYTDCGEPLS